MDLEIRYELSAVARCPVDGRVDVYVCTVEPMALIKVEDLLAAVGEYAERAIFQEDLTAELAERFDCRVTTMGQHSGVRTVVEAYPS